MVLTFTVGDVPVSHRLPFEVTEGNETGLSLGDFPPRVLLRLQLHFALKDLASLGHLGPEDKVIAVHALEHIQLLADCFLPVRPVCALGCLR